MFRAVAVPIATVALAISGAACSGGGSVAAAPPLSTAARQPEASAAPTVTATLATSPASPGATSTPGTAPNGTPTPAPAAGASSVPTATATLPANPTVAGVTATSAPDGTVVLSDLSQPMAFGTNPPPPKQALCVNGTQFLTTQDDEFAQDRYLDATSADIDDAPSAMWGTRIWYNAPNAPGYPATGHDEVDTDASFTPYYSPFRKAVDGSLEIAAVPIPAAHLNDAILDSGPGNRPHYLSGLLNGRAQTYGYIEVSARETHALGMWPAPLWLIAHHGSDGNGNGYSEMDANEIFGTGGYPVFQTFHRNGNGPDLASNESPVASDSVYHTYGIYWTATTIAFLTDRVVTGGPYSNQDIASIGAIAATGPESPMINMQVFGQGGFAPPAAAGTTGALNDRWFRWYQDTSVPCALSQITVAPPTPSPV